MRSGVMRREPPLPQELWDQIPLPVQAALWVLIESYERRNAALEAEVAELKEHLQQTSQNSARPPSTDGPAVKRAPPRAPSGRNRGAQPGHARYERTRVPLGQVKEGIPGKPPHGRRCGSAGQGPDAQPRRHPVLELPPFAAEVTEDQRHRVVGAQGGSPPCGALPPGVPRSGSGPRLVRVVAWWTGA